MDCWAVRGTPSSRLAFFTAAFSSFRCFRDSFFEETGAEDAAFAFLDFFLSMDNSLYLLLKFVLTNQGCIVVVSSVGAHLGTDDFCLNEVLGNLLQRLTIFLLHAEKEHGQHDQHHPQRCQRDIAGPLQKEEYRNADDGCGGKTYQLPLRQIEKNFGFNPCKVTGNGNISCHLASLMCIEYGFGKSAGLEQSETQQYRVPHNTPQGCDDVLGESDTLNENGIDANTDKNEESL